MPKLTLSLRRAIALAAIVGLLLPALFGAWQTLRQQRAALTAALEDDLQHSATLMASGLAHAFWSLDRDSIQAFADAAAADQRIVRITLNAGGDAVLRKIDGEIPGFYRPERQHGRLLTALRPVLWKDRQIGTVSLEMDAGQLEARLQQDFEVFLATAAAQIVLSLSLIMLILNARFVRPVQRLLSESAQLARRELDQPFVWRRRDELGTLGNSLESTRIALQAAFKDIRESEQRFRSLTSLSSDWYWERDEHDRIVSISQGFQDITGIDPQRLQGTRRGESDAISYPQDRHWAECQALIAAHAPFYEMQWQAMHPDGKMRYGSISGVPVVGEAGQFRGYRGIGKDMTAARLAEAAQNSAARLRQLVEHLPAGAIYIEDGVTLLNQVAEQLTAYPRSEIANTAQWFEKMFGADAERQQRLYEQDKAGGFAAPREIAITRKDGACYTLEFTAYCDEHNEVWLLHDLTQRKLAEARLQHALQEQQILLDNALVGIAFARDRVIQRCNRSFEQMYGYAPGELIGQSTRVFFPSDEAWEAFGTTLLERLNAGKSYVSDQQVLRKDGTLIWGNGHGRAIDPQDLSKGVIWVVQDITARKLAEDALRQSLLEQQAIFDNANVGINLVKNRMFTRCNRGFEEMLGYQQGELTGKPTRLIHASGQIYETLGRSAYEAINAGRSWIGEVQLVRKNGELILCSAHGRALDAADLSKGSIWVVQDITARKAAEAALVEANNKLELGLAEVEQTHREVTLLGELSSFLQACQSAREAYDSLVSYGPRLFPASGGALYLIEEGGELQVQASWGEPDYSAPNFLPGDCWALRRGQPYRMDDAACGLCCPHLHGGGQRPYPYACLPLVAQGETFGLLFIEHRCTTDGGTQRDMRQRLAVSLAEQVGLALANIRLREELHLQSIRDPLTGLYNRRYLNDVMRRELLRARRAHDSLAVAIIDIDYFKRFNDTFGHDAGDHVLQNVARALQEQVRQCDVVCRLGGEEFVVLLAEISADTAQQRAGGLLAAVRALSLTHGNRALGRITASLGLALYPLHGDSAEALLAAADAALYQAKENGRDRYIIVETV